MITKIKKLSVALLLAVPLLGGLPVDTVDADHNRSHCQEQNPGFNNIPEVRELYTACIAGIPDTFGEWSTYCLTGNPVDAQYRSCMITNTGGESPIGMPGGSWCESSGGGITYYYNQMSCPSGASTLDVPLTFGSSEGDWCAVRGPTGTFTTFIVGLECTVSSYTSPTSNPFSEGSPENPGSGEGPGPGGVGDRDVSQEEGEGFVLNPPNAELGTAAPVGRDNEFFDFLITVVDFLSIGVSIVAAITVAVSGMQYMSSRGDPNKTAKAIGRMTQAGLAILMYVFGWALLNWLIPGGALNPPEPAADSSTYYKTEQQFTQRIYYL